MISRVAIFLCIGCAAALCIACANNRAADDEPIPGIGPSGPVTKLHGRLGFTEGPAADYQGNTYFTDIPNNRILRIGADGALSVFLEPSAHTNGLMFDGQGTLVACQMDGRLVSINTKSKQIMPLAAEFEDQRFNAPNDLVIDSQGGIYFTDPRFRAPEPWPQGKEAVYYRGASGQITRLLDSLPAPNGVILSPDEKTLYVIPSLSSEMMAYDVAGPGRLENGRVFCQLKQPAGQSNSGGDGLTIDTHGNLYITSELGVQVFDPAGKLLGIIGFPEQPANVTFSGDGLSTLFVTARTSVYSVPMQAAGHRFPGSLK